MLPKQINRISSSRAVNGTRKAKDNGGDRVVNVERSGEVYRCNVCGNVVSVKESGGGELVCHGEPMQRIEEPGHKSG